MLEGTDPYSLPRGMEKEAKIILFRSDFFFQSPDRRNISVEDGGIDDSQSSCASNSPSSTSLASPPKYRRQNCGTCKGCVREDCGKCGSCLRNSSSEENKKRKAKCSMRSCFRPALPKTARCFVCRSSALPPYDVSAYIMSDPTVSLAECGLCGKVVHPLCLFRRYNLSEEASHRFYDHILNAWDCVFCTLGVEVDHSIFAPKNLRKLAEEEPVKKSYGKPVIDDKLLNFKPIVKLSRIVSPMAKPVQFSHFTDELNNFTAESSIGGAYPAVSNSYDRNSDDIPTESVSANIAESLIDNAAKSPIDNTAESSIGNTTKSPFDKTTELPIDNADELPVHNTNESPNPNTAKSRMDNLAELPVDNAAESPMDSIAGSPIDHFAGSPIGHIAGSLMDSIAGSPVDNTGESSMDSIAGSPVDYIAGSPINAFAESPLDNITESPIGNIPESINVEPIDLPSEQSSKKSLPSLRCRVCAKSDLPSFLLTCTECGQSSHDVCLYVRHRDDPEFVAGIRNCVDARFWECPFCLGNRGIRRGNWVRHGILWNSARTRTVKEKTLEMFSKHTGNIFVSHLTIFDEEIGEDYASLVNLPTYRGLNGRGGDGGGINAEAMEVTESTNNGTLLDGRVASNAFPDPNGNTEPLKVLNLSPMISIKCEFCSRSDFASADALSHHVTSQHPKCGHCSRELRFEDIPKILSHFKTEHEKMKRCKILIAGQTLTLAMNASVHG